MINKRGTYTLFAKEVSRFMKVAVQTIVTPIITILLYLLIFSSVLSKQIELYKGVGYSTFLIPGLIMMAILQNSFANNSSSLFQSKLNGNIVFMLLAPLSGLEIYIAYTASAIFRGLLVGIGAWIVSCGFEVIPVYNPFIMIAFALMGSGILGSFGMIAAICADKWDHIAAFQNFVVLPLSFLSGAFYSINTLPSLWQKISMFNPFLYVIDGFRYGFLGQSDISIILSFSVTACFLVLIGFISLWLLHSGYKLRN